MPLEITTEYVGPEVRDGTVGEREWLTQDEARRLHRAHSELVELEQSRRGTYAGELVVVNQGGEHEPPPDESFEQAYLRTLELLQGLGPSCTCAGSGAGHGMVHFGDVRPKPEAPNRQGTVVYCLGCQGVICAAASPDLLAAAPQLKQLAMFEEAP